MHGVRGEGERGVVTMAANQPTAARKGLEGLMDWLVTEKGLTRVEACMLIGVTRNLKIVHELDLPVYTVTASVTPGIFMTD